MMEDFGLGTLFLLSKSMELVIFIMQNLAGMNLCIMYSSHLSIIHRLVTLVQFIYWTFISILSLIIVKLIKNAIENLEHATHRKTR